MTDLISSVGERIVGRASLNRIHAIVGGDIEKRFENEEIIRREGFFCKDIIYHKGKDMTIRTDLFRTVTQEFYAANFYSEGNPSEEIRNRISDFCDNEGAELRC